MSIFPLKASHKPVKGYYAALAQFHEHGHTTEGNTRACFADLLKRCASPYGWHLVEEFPFKGTNKQPLRADGALVDDLTLVHGLWEAKDTSDDLQKEIKLKVAKGYLLTNILFQSPDRAVLYQDSRIAFDGQSQTLRSSSKSSSSSSITSRPTRSIGEMPSPNLPRRFPISPTASQKSLSRVREERVPMWYAFYVYDEYGTNRREKHHRLGTYSIPQPLR